MEGGWGRLLIKNACKLVRVSSFIMRRTLMSLSLKSDMSVQSSSMNKSLIKPKTLASFEPYHFVIFFV